MPTDPPKSRKRRSDIEILQAAESPDSDTLDHAIDPAYAAAVQVLNRALAAGRIPAADLKGIVVLEVPDATWVGPVATAWRDVVRAVRLAEGPHNGSGFHRRDWLAFHGEGKESRYQAGQASEQVVEAAWQGQNLVGVSHALDRHLPRDLVRAADLRLVLGPLDADLLSETAQVVTAGVPASLPGADVCALITSTDLRLARRRGQSADDFVRRVGRLAAARMSGAPRAERTLDSLPGMDAAVAWGRDLTRDLAAYAAGRLAWADVDRGCLLVGPPGTGKTTFARALAATCRVPLVLSSYARWQAAREGHLGDLLKAMAATFDEARKAAPCILFIDELDSFHSRTADTRHRDWWTAVVGALLEHLDGIEGHEGVVVVGATNHADMVDPAIVRSGRLDRTISIPLPDAAALAAILRVHLADDLAGADLSQAALLALGATGADCERWARGARRRARNAGRPMLLPDLLAEIRDGARRSPEGELRLFAIHEAGHALLQALEQPGTLKYVSIRQRREEAGHVAVDVAGGVLTEGWLGMQMRGLLAGRAAEEMVLGRVTGGAGGPGHSDLARATRLALNMETALGLSEQPLLWQGFWEDRDLASLLLDRPDLARRAEARLQAAYAAACGCIREHRDVLEAIIAGLLDRDVLTGAEVEAVVMEGRRR